MKAIDTVRYKNDAQLRKRLFVAAAFAHPAKGHISLWQEMIERYSRPGDIILDPMAGIGTSLIAALMGRNVICVELERHFVEPMHRSWEKMRNMPMLGYQVGQAVILRGDARALPLPDASVGAAITSPPYEAAGWKADENPDNIQQREDKRRLLYPMRPALPGRYTRPVDAIVTSPPFQDNVMSGKQETPHGGSDYRGFSVNAPYSHNSTTEATKARGLEPTNNIGNLRNAAYWSAMRQVYAECWRVLRPGGILALVLKGFTRSGQYQDLPGQTEALLLAAGWQKHDHWRRELWSLSFWRILQKRKSPDTFDDRLNFEEVIAFRKGHTPNAE